MLFTSAEFLIFLPVIFGLYWLLSRWLQWQNALIVVASYVFYGWWDWRFLVLIAFTSLCSYVFGLLISKALDKGESRKSRLFNVLNIVVNIAILALFKYHNFFVESLISLFPRIGAEKLLLHLILPVGISFYTFQALSYTIDVYRQKIEPTRDVVQFFAYVSFFPQLVAGPIERATQLLPQFDKQKQFDYAVAVDGIRQMLWGFFKKIVVADNCAVFVDNVWENYSGQHGSTLLVAAFLFSIQIYCDFSGYSDIAIGCAKLFGIRLMRNFNVPYFSRDIAEFWRRWHISLTTWFRDYIYIPMGGSRVSKAKVIRNTLVIFLVSGLWHGANWTFVVWGAYHAVLFLPLIILGKNRKYTNVVAEGRALPTVKEFGQILLTFVLAMIGWVLFRSETIGQAWDFLLGMFSKTLFAAPAIPAKTLLFVAIMLVVEWVQRKKEHGFVMDGVKSGLLRYACYLAVLAVIFVFGVFNESFIYFQF